MEKRREFLKSAGAFAAGSLIVPFGCSPKKPQEAVAEKAIETTKSKDIGLQIYTLRNEIDRDGVESVLEKVAKIGFKWIEPFGYEDRKFLKKTPQEFKQILSSLGLKAPSVHSVNEISSSGKEAILDQMKSTAEDALAIGVEYLVWSYLKEEDRTSMDDYKRHIETWNKFGEVCKETGIQFAYHNHAFEFEDIDGVKPFDMIMKGTDSDLVKFELDLYWVNKAEENPVEWFNKEPGRFPLWHVKDMTADETKFFAPVGDGIIDFKTIFEARKASGLKYFYVEQDATKEGVSPFDTIKTSWNYLNNADFV